MKILITHDDLDGLGCEVVARAAFPDIRCWRVGYKDIYSALQEAISEEPETLIIADVWPDDPTSYQILVNFPGELYIYDHHTSSFDAQSKVLASRLELGLVTDGIWVTSDRGVCASSLMAKRLNISLPSIEYIEEYDNSGTTDGIAGALNLLFYEISRTEMRDILRRDPLEFTKEEKAKLNEVLEKCEDSYQKALKTMSVETIHGHKVAVCESTKDKAYIYNRLLEQNDYAILLDKKRDHVGIRGIYEGCNVVAEKMGGGGHPQAAGATGVMPVESIFNRFKEVLAE